jgi:hypothetical protein
MVAHTASSCGSSSCRSSPSDAGHGQQQPPQQPQQRFDGKKRQKKGGKKNFYGGPQQQQQHYDPPASPWVCFSPWTGQQGGQPWTGQTWRAPGVLGSAPQAHTAFAPLHVSPPAPHVPQSSAPSWDQAVLIAALQQMSMQDSSPWVMDSGASAHMSSNDGILLHRLFPLVSYIIVGNDTKIPVTSSGPSILHTKMSNFALNNVLVAPFVVRNLLSVRQFTREHSCSIEFDAFGFSVKDLRTGHVTIRWNSDGDLYTLPAAPPSTASTFLAESSSLWHQRLGHPGPTVLAALKQRHSISCNKVDRSLCHSCQLGKHTRLPFSASVSNTIAPFELLHCDVWTSPVTSISGYSYYLVILDDYSHYCWTFPLRQKSKVHDHMINFIAYAYT